MIPSDLSTFICEQTQANRIQKMESIQSLWSGYGQIVRCYLDGARVSSVIVKQVQWPAQNQRESKVSHQRKVRSYQVELNWYQQGALRCDDHCRVPHSLGQRVTSQGIWLILEDLNAAGYSGRRHSGCDADAKASLRWLAYFHARFLGEKPTGLWKTGTYWHLKTRPDELKSMNDSVLRQAAPAIDQALRMATWQTWVHGDSKLANFCFTQDGSRVAAVDFQYVGGGVGVQDVAYLIDSCYTEDAAGRLEQTLLDYYFSQLRQGLKLYKPDVNFESVEQEWRLLYPVAWTDFHRFLKGWSPGRWNPQGYSERTAKQVIAQLGGGAL